MAGQSCSQDVEQNILKAPQVVVVMVPFPAHGHINQLHHLSHLITSYNIPVHLAGPATHNRRAKLRTHGWDPQTSSKIHFHDFQLPPFSSVKSVPPYPNNNIHIKFPAHLQLLSDAPSHLYQPVSRLLHELSAKFRKVIVIHDNLMTSAVQDVKYIPNAESYAFLSVSVFTIFINKWESLIEKPFQLDSDVPRCVPPGEGCFTPEFENFMAHQHKILNFESGRLFNTSRVIEGKYMDLLAKLPSNANKKLFAIGPFNPLEREKGTRKRCRHRCLEWLDKQERNSVIYISFGTTTSMDDEQILELAIGLERSGQKFVWVLRSVDNDDVSTEEDEGENPKLPEGYEERVKSRGMVVRDWAPQLEILAHPAIGGFMSHCGWSSCMESISMGVPIAAWPMHSDQPKNSILITEVLRIGVLVRDWACRAEVVTSITIEDVVRKLMASKEGQEMRIRAAELGGSVRSSFAKGGASRLEMDSFIAHIIK